VSAQSIFNMSTLRALAIVYFACALPFSIATAAEVFKCSIGGTVTYQASPCPSGEARRGPTVEQLNAERQTKLRLSADSAGAQKAPMAGGQSPAAALTPAPTPTALRVTTRKCDGRTVCSQMTSCAEAKHFLANCPGTRMDGDGDGTPCEQQWCNK
jgi:Excalibur calcium-binding domain